MHLYLLGAAISRMCTNPFKARIPGNTYCRHSWSCNIIPASRCTSDLRCRPLYKRQIILSHTPNRDNRVRTGDTLDISQLLWPLSYVPLYIQKTPRCITESLSAIICMAISRIILINAPRAMSSLLPVNGFVIEKTPPNN